MYASSAFNPTCARSGFTGAAIVLSPLAFIFLGIDLHACGEVALWRWGCALLVVLCTLCMGWAWRRSPAWGRFISLVDAGACIFTAGRDSLSDPFVALTVIMAVSLLLYAIFHYHPQEQSSDSPEEREREALRGAVGGLVALFALNWLIEGFQSSLGSNLCATGAVLCQGLLYPWSLKFRSPLPRYAILACILLLLGTMFQGEWLAIVATVLTIFIDLLLLNSYGQLELREDLGLEFFLKRPARMVLATFVILCSVGSVLLYLPVCLAKEAEFLDIAFLAVSASCVTGLSVIDPSSTLTVTGKIVLMLLMQLGGLGIMSLSALAMHVLGQRMSLRHERLAVSAAGSEDTGELLQTLGLVLRYLVAIEVLAAIILAYFLHDMGESWDSALGNGCFMAVAAFCNAGISPYHDSLFRFSSHPGILYVMGIVGVCGGMAPAAFLSLPLWFYYKRQITLSSLVTLVPTAILLIGGMGLFLISEWTGVLGHFSLIDKMHNAFHMSATLRTVGFSTFDLSGINNFSYVLCLFLMLIGGSPGGTAGGIKTASLSILFLVFWADLRQRPAVVYRRRLIPDLTIRRTITIVLSFILALILSVGALLATQDIAVKPLIFEAVSALGTVGLSMGVTNQLDELGKIIIILTMFCGRVGPLTILSLMSVESTGGNTVRYPEEKISLT